MARSKPKMDDPRVHAFIDWLCTIKRDRQPSSQKELAEQLGLHDDQVLADWKNDPVFFEEWQRRYRKGVGSPEKQQAVIEALYESATDRTDPRQVPAAKAYLEAVGAVQPKKVDVSVSKDIDKLTDDEINALIESETGRGK